MRALVQRVSGASVTVGEVVERIEAGLVVFVGVGQEDDEEDARYIVDKVVNLRIFEDEAERFDHSALDVSAQLLVVSQFTLYGDVRKGRRPSFSSAAPPDAARPLFEQIVNLFRETGLTVKTGRFQERMMVEILNDGPVTIAIDSVDRRRPRRG